MTKTPIIDPYSDKTYQVFSYIIAAFFLISCVNIALLFFPSIHASLSDTGQPPPLPFVLNMFCFASYVSVIVVCQLVGKSAAFRTFLLILFLCWLLTPMATHLVSGSTLRILLMLNGLAVIAFIIAMFCIGHRTLGPLFSWLGAVSVVPVAVAGSVFLIPTPFRYVPQLVRLLPIVVLFMIVTTARKLLKRDKQDEAFLEGFDPPTA